MPTCRHAPMPSRETQRTQPSPDGNTPQLERRSSTPHPSPHLAAQKPPAAVAPPLPQQRRCRRPREDRGQGSSGACQPAPPLPARSTCSDLLTWQPKSRPPQWRRRSRSGASAASQEKTGAKAAAATASQPRPSQPAAPAATSSLGSPKAAHRSGAAAPAAVPAHAGGGGETAHARHRAVTPMDPPPKPAATAAIVLLQWRPKS